MSTPIPPRPPEPPTQQSEPTPRPKSKSRAPLIAGGTALAVVAVGAGAFFGYRAMQNDGEASVASEQSTTGEANPGAEETEAAPAETNMFDPETMEYTVDNLKMETEADPTRMAEVYLNRHNAWSMAGTETPEERKELYQEYLNYPEDDAEGISSNWHVGIDVAEKHKDTFAEALAGPNWKDNPETAKWVEDRYKQNAVDVGAFIGVYDPALESQPDGFFRQDDTLDGPVEVVEETEDGEGNTLRTVKYPVHSVATNQESSDPAIPEYDYKLDLTTTFKDLEDGTSVVVEETYSDRYDVVVEPTYTDIN